MCLLADEGEGREEKRTVKGLALGKEDEMKELSVESGRE